MEIRAVTDTYFVTPQIDAGDIPAIVEAGFKTVICNRPDSEVPPSHQALAIETAARAAGLEFHVLPLTHQTMTPDNIAKQMAFCNSQSPVLAYCASGTRCTVAWAIGTATAGQDVGDILTTAQKAGYQLDGLRPTLEAVSPKT